MEAIWDRRDRYVHQPPELTAPAKRDQIRPVARETPLLAALRGSFSSIRLVWADGGYPGRLLGWAKGVLALRVEIIKRLPGSTGFHVRPRVWVVERTFGWIIKHRRCRRAYETRPDDSRGRDQFPNAF